MSWQTLCLARLNNLSCFGCALNVERMATHIRTEATTSGNPSYECIVEDDDTRQEMIEHGHSEAYRLKTKVEAEKALGEFFDQYVTEWHPAKDEDGNWHPDTDEHGSALRPCVFDVLNDTKYKQPQCVDLLELLDGNCLPGQGPSSEEKIFNGGLASF